ncbi:MAG TPA: dihydrofolate reductase family protein [Methylomirabilota bacterium]|nr:dihydrofolate reductase family protein [Methylomirabilota bacterium]
MTDAPHLVDRLWPDPVAGLTLAQAMDGFQIPRGPAGRPLVAMNMVTSIDGRAQLNGSADGLGSRADRLLMRHYRAAFDAVASGAGTLRATGVWMRVGDELAARRAAEGRPANPTGVVVAGAGPVPADATWFEGDEPRILVVGADNALGQAPAGTELLRAPDPVPEPRWVLDRLAERGIGTLLLEGGPHLNAAFLAQGLIDEAYWTVGAHMLGTDALPMVAPIPGGSPFAGEPRRANLMSVLRHDDELFLRYRFDTAG